MDRERLIERLPPFQDRWVTVKKDHDVNDIIDDILKKHKQFAPYYDRIALLFDNTSISKICESLYRFCKDNIKYKEEKGEDQTTSIPTGILIRGYGDCKHYASFIGGILDSIERQTGKKIDWHYRFVSYKILERTPHHVFIVVNDKDGEIWIDPTPGAEKKYPYWQEDIYTEKNKTMPLRSNIGTVNQVGLLPILDTVLNDPEVQQSVANLATSITDQFTNLINSFVIGDQVPNYPIKSKNTYSKIITQISAEFPPPNTIEEARDEYKRAIEQRDIAHTKAVQKGSADKPYAVDETYAIIYQETANTLRNAIDQYEGAVTRAGSKTGSGPLTPPTAKSNLPLYLGLGLAGFLLLKPGKKTSGIGGVNTSTLLLLGIGGFLLFKSFGSTGSTDKRAAVKGKFMQEGSDGSIADRMTDQEISDVYELFFVYLPQGDTLTKDIPADLKTRLMAIGAKYNIFT